MRSEVFILQEAMSAGHGKRERVSTSGAINKEEMAWQQIINARKGEIVKGMGKLGESRQAMQDFARRAFYTKGHEGKILKQVSLELATEMGNLNDVFYGFSDLYFNDEETREDINEKFSRLGYSEDEVEKMFTECSGETIKQFTTSYLGLKRELVEGGREACTASDVSRDDQYRLRAVAAISQAAKDAGHWEQVIGSKDYRTGQYYIMDERERRDEIVNEAKKRGMRDFLRLVAPEVFLQRKRKLITGEEEGGRWEYVPDEEAPKEGTFEYEMFQRLLGGQHIPELRQMQSRVPEQLISKYFDDSGNLIDSEEEAAAKGFSKVTDGAGGAKKTALQSLRENFFRTLNTNKDIVEGMWSWKYLGKPGEKPGEDRGRVYPWEAGYIQVVKAEEINEYRKKLEDNIKYQEVELTVNKYIPDVNHRIIFNIKQLLTDVKYAGRFSMVTRESVITRARGMNLETQWKGGDKNELKKLKREFEILAKEIETNKDFQTGMMLEDGQITEKEQRSKTIEDQMETEGVKGGWTNKENAEKVIRILSDEAREDLRKKLEEELKTMKEEKIKSELIGNLMSIGQEKMLKK